MAHQLDCLDLVMRLNREAGRTVVLVLHDLNLAAGYADQVALMQAGRLVAAGAPHEIMTAERLSAVFAHPIAVLPHPIRGGCPLVLPLPANSIQTRNHTQESPPCLSR
jgi:iron complex transport system ATP-binding protein